MPFLYLFILPLVAPVFIDEITPGQFHALLFAWLVLVAAIAIPEARTKIRATR